MLRVLLAVCQAVAKLQHKPFARRQVVQDALYVPNRHTANHRFLQRIGLCAENVLIGDFVAFSVAADRVGKRNIVAPFAAGAKGHQDFIFDAARRIGTQRRAGG